MNLGSIVARQLLYMLKSPNAIAILSAEELLNE